MSTSRASDMIQIEQNFKTDTGWQTISKIRCYYKQRRFIEFLPNISHEDAQKWINKEKEDWHGQEFFVYDIDFPKVELLRAADSGD
jgi:protoheme ferro-lyase